MTGGDTGSRPRRILHLIDSWGPGGAETVFVDLVSRLDPGRWEGTAVVPRAGWVSKALEDRGVTPLFLPSAGSVNLRYLIRLVQAIRQQRVDLVQAHLFGAALYGSLAGILTGVPVICTLHGRPDLDNSGRALRLRFGLLRRGARRIVCVSESLREHLHRKGDYPRDRSRVIHNGIDGAVFRPGTEPELRESFGASEGDVLVGTVANLRPAKALDVFVRAAAILAASEPRARFVIVGQTDDTILPELEALARELGLENRLHFAGFRDDIARVMRAFDVFVSSSDSEGFSLVIVQAMASGVPVVATRSGGPDEIVRSGMDGLLVDVRSPGELAQSVVTLIRDPGRAGAIRESARLRVHDRFSLNAMLQGYESLYQEVLSESLRAPRGSHESAVTLPRSVKG